MAASTTALPFGADGYECFAKKGACRKCGVTAYFKRKCQRCHRKFCNACAPNSLQRYGDHESDECCIGCEPFLVVAPADAEPILELEPESEDLAPNSPTKPIHVPLSAISAPGGGDQPQSPPLSPNTLPTDTEDDNDSVSTKSAGGLLSSVPSPVDFLGLPSWQQIQDKMTGTATSAPQQDEYRTPVPTRNLANLHLLDEPPVTPDQGCCTACQVYSTGKTPCPSCGTKYCHEAACQDYLYEDGSCAKCRTRGRIVRPPPMPVEAGCCTACRQYAMGKEPCENCGAKYCQEVACQNYLFDNGTCAACH